MYDGLLLGNTDGDIDGKILGRIDGYTLGDNMDGLCEGTSGLNDVTTDGLVEGK